MRRVVILPRSAPKTASSTLKTAIRRHNDDQCGTEFDKDQHYFNRFTWNVSALNHLVHSCTKAHMFWVENRSACNSINPHTKNCKSVYIDPTLLYDYANVSFINTIPFRPFRAWASSAFRQIAKFGNHSITCNRILKNNLARCTGGFAEFDFYRYSKWILKMTIQQVLLTTQTKNSRSTGNHFVVLYNYKDSDYFFEQIQTHYKMNPIKMKSQNTGHSDRSCNPSLLQEFHECYDKLL